MAPLRQGLRTNQIKKLVVRSLPGLAEGMRYHRSKFELVQKLKKLSADPRIQNQSEDEYRAALAAALPGLLKEASQEVRAKEQAGTTAMKAK